jgi:two-component system response regulator DesR
VIKVPRVQFYIYESQILAARLDSQFREYPAKEGVEDMERRQEDDGGCPLTPEQLHVLQVAHDLDTTVAKKIAKHLGISHNTVRNHLESAAERIETNERAQTVAVALAMGWIKEDRNRPG